LSPDIGVAQLMEKKEKVKWEEEDQHNCPGIEKGARIGK